jgi:hypothetical protein
VTDTPATISIHITHTPDGGFIAWEGGNPIAARTWRFEMADWLEDRLGQAPGEAEREARAADEVRKAKAADEQPAADNVEPFPRALRERTKPPSEPRRKYVPW